MESAATKPRIHNARLNRMFSHGLVKVGIHPLLGLRAGNASAYFTEIVVVFDAFPLMVITSGWSPEETCGTTTFA